MRTDRLDRDYGTQAWRKLAAAVIIRDQGICHLCGEPGADTAHHLVEKRQGGADDPANLRAVHRGCHNRAHGRRGVSIGAGIDGATGMGFFVSVAKMRKGGG